VGREPALQGHGEPVRPQQQEDPAQGASRANPLEAHFGPLRQFTLADSDHSNDPVQTRALHAYLRWRNVNSRRPDVVMARRKERARIRSEKGLRWGGRPQHVRAADVQSLG
jgi:hypothetical protein